MGKTTNKVEKSKSGFFFYFNECLPSINLHAWPADELISQAWGAKLSSNQLTTACVYWEDF
jgi:hypothetical protein